MAKRKRPSDKDKSLHDPDLNDTGAGVIVSGWFEPAERYKDLEASWRQEMEQMGKRGFPAAQDVERSDLGS